ncbi:MAG: FlgD immunoglobulin-like domain containing protein [Calditrichaceae bacterium]
MLSGSVRTGIFLILIFVIDLAGQTVIVPQLQRDDFEKKRDWWYFRADYPWGVGVAQIAPAVNNGYLHFLLRDPKVNIYHLPNDMNNVAIESAKRDPVDNLYTGDDVVLFKTRVKFLTPHLPGSRGWGFWYTEGTGIPTVIEQYWFMDSKEEAGHSWTASETWWQTQKVNGPVYSSVDRLDLSAGYQSGWHTYEMRRYGMSNIEYYVDGVLVMNSVGDLPEYDYDFHMWIDNQIYHNIPTVGDSFRLEIYNRLWTGTNEFLTDYVQIIVGSDPVGYSVSPSGVIKLREYPNEIAPGDERLWKNYSFNSDGGRAVIIVTAKAEEYDGYDSQDQLKIKIDNKDYGYSGAKGWDGNILQTATKTVVIDSIIPAGAHQLQLYSRITPILYDATVLNAINGEALINQDFNITGPSESSNYLLQSVPFTCSQNGMVAIYATASADENHGWSFEGPGSSYQNVDDSADDDLRVALYQGANLLIDYGWQTAESWYGNRLFGEVKSVLLQGNLNAGNYELRFYSNNTPTLRKVLVYVQNGDASLPVELTSFKASHVSDGIQIEWVTESELENTGYNIYRAAGSDTLQPGESEFIKINQKLIPGAGNSSSKNVYTFLDSKIMENTNYWYMLEDISYSGARTSHKPVYILSVSREAVTGSFRLLQNYPNPFNPVTTIPFRLYSPGKIVIDIFNVKGQKIRRLTEKQFTVGDYEISWDGRTDAGNPAGSGIYYVRMLNGVFQQTRKMILIH